MDGNVYSYIVFLLGLMVRLVPNVHFILSRAALYKNKDKQVAKHGIGQRIEDEANTQSSN